MFLKVMRVVSFKRAETQSREFTSWLKREGQNVIFAMITIAAQRFPNIFGSPPSIFIIFVSLNSYKSRLNSLKVW